MYTVDEARSVYNGLFSNTDFTAIDEVLVTTATGCAKAAKTLNKMIETAVEEGVSYVCSSAKTLDGTKNGLLTLRFRPWPRNNAYYQFLKPEDATTRPRAAVLCSSQSLRFYSCLKECRQSQTPYPGL